MTAAPVARALASMAPFTPGPQDDDAAVFAAAREQFLIPAGRRVLQHRHAGRIAARSGGRADRRHSPPRDRARGLALRTARWRAADGIPAAARGPPRGGPVRQCIGGRDRAHAERDDGHELPRQRPRPGRGRRGRQHRPGARRGHLALAPAREAPRRRRQGAAAGAGTRGAGRTRSCACSSPR